MKSPGDLKSELRKLSWCCADTHHYNNKLCRQWCEKLCSFYRPPPLTSYHHLLDPASAAATRPLLLAAGLYGANSLALPPPIPPPPHVPASILPTSNEDRRAPSCGTATGGPLDLSHLASNHHHVPGLDNCNGAVGGGSGAMGKLPSAASVHSFLQLHKSAGIKRLKWTKKKHFTEMSNSTTLFRYMQCT